MKKLFMISCFFFIPIVSHCQIFHSSGIGFGYSSATFFYSGSSGLQNTFKNYNFGTIGVSLEYLGGNFFHVESEISFIRKGVDGQYLKIVQMEPFMTRRENFSQYFNFISISTGLKLFEKFSFLTPYITVAPRFSYLINYNKTNAFYFRDENLIKLTFGGLIKAGSVFQVSSYQFFTEGILDADFQSLTKTRSATITHITVLFRVGTLYQF